MIRSQLVKSMKQYTGAGVITRKKLMQFLGYKDRMSVEKYVYGLRKFGAGYAIEDVADRIMEESYR